jgi:hypothetical protein
MSTLIILLAVATVGISACAPEAGSAPDTNILAAQGIAQAIPAPGWQQANGSGFGDPKELEVSALEPFNGYLYAGTYNVVDPLQLFDGARIFRSPDGVTTVRRAFKTTLRTACHSGLCCVRHRNQYGSGW